MKITTIPCGLGKLFVASTGFLRNFQGKMKSCERCQSAKAPVAGKKSAGRTSVRTRIDKRIGYNWG